MASNPHPIRGYLYISAATFLWGVSASLGRAVFTGRLLPAGLAVGPIDPVTLSQFRTTLSFLAILPVYLVVRGTAGLRLPTADLVRLLVLGVLGVAASNYFYYLAIQKANVAIAIILQYTAPVWVLTYTVARGLQRPSLQRIAAVMLAVLGIAITIGVGYGQLHLRPMGVIAGFLAAFSFAFYVIAGHNVIARQDHWTVLLFTTMSAALFWILINPPWKIIAAHYSRNQWLFLLVFALISMLGPFSFYFAGLKHLEPTRAVIVSCLEPVFTVLIAAVTLGEVIRPIQGLGIALILFAILLLQVREGSTPISAVDRIE